MILYKTLLLVDDDVDDQEIFVLALQEIERSITCLIAGNGQEALLTLGSRARLPELIFLDMNMPRMNGMEFLKNIKTTESLKDIPVIVYSTTTEQSVVEASKALGAMQVMKKPARYTELCRQLSTLLIVPPTQPVHRHEPCDE